MKGGGALVHVYVWNTESALTTESLDGYLPNLVGIKSTHDICFDFWAKSAQWWIKGRVIIGQ